MSQTSHKKSGRSKRDKRYDKIEVSRLPDDLLCGIKETTLAKSSHLQDFVNSAIAGREVTNDVDDLRDWCARNLAEKTLIVARNREEYYEIVRAALESLPGQCRIGIGSEERPLMKMLSEKVQGYMAEFCVQKWARRIGVDLEVAHELGRPSDFLHSDFPRVRENGRVSPARTNVGAKSGLKNALWLDLPRSQLQKTHAQIFVRLTVGKNHLDNDAILNIVGNKYLSATKWHGSFTEWASQIENGPIAAYVVGFATKPDANSFFYDGWRGRNTYHITELAGRIPPNFKDEIRKSEGLPKGFKIKVLAIGDFKRLKQGPIYVWNSGSIMKSKEEIDQLIRSI